MRIRYRFVFYGIGFFIGIILLYFFVGGSGASCDMSYGPNARVLKNINLKTINYSQNISDLFENKTVDTADIKYILKIQTYLQTSI